jgi:hypothetical protein
MPARIRTTWTSRKADDPRAMNQDHLSRQPAADQYDIGGPSEFAEDVAPADWKGQARNEIGMPEIRPESLKQAAQFSVLKDRAALCLKIAAKLLGKKASESLIEDQAIALMNMGDHGVISTLGRIAASQEDSEDTEDEDEGQEKQAQDQSDEDEVQDKQAGEMPPQFKENAEKKQEEAAEKAEKKEAAQEEQADEAQAKQAQEEQQDQGQAKQAQEQIAQQIQQLAQQLQSLQQQLGQQTADQVVQQQIAQQQAPVAQQQPQVAQQQIQEDTSVLDQLLAQDEVQAPMANEDIELFGGAFDTEAAQLGDEDQTLQAIFAGGQETQDALAAQGCVTASAPVRTVGTRPTVGVARIASASSRSAGSQDSSLDSLWSAPPDVSSAFR